VTLGALAKRWASARSAIAVALLALGCGSERGASPLAGVASCDDADGALADTIFTEQAAHLACTHDADCSSVWYLVARDDARCIDHGCLLAVSSAGATTFSTFLATDPGITALCGYLRDNQCPRVVADCFPSEPACERQRCTMRDIE